MSCVAVRSGLCSCAGCCMSRRMRSEVATYGESLALLSASARDGRLSAQIALERALRGGEQPPWRA